MSDNSKDVSDHVKAIQDAVQDTGGGSDSDMCGTDSSSSETEGANSNSRENNPTSICSGDGGCGETFPSDTLGCDFEFAMLCSTCYKKASTGADSINNGKEGGTSENESDSSVEPLNNIADNGEEEEEVVNDNDNATGKEMGLVLQNVRDIDKTGRYDVEAGGNLNVYVAYINDQDNITRKCKKFWHLLPNPSHILYGYLNYHACHRAWLGHCRLKTDLPDADGNGYVLWEIWETRCNRPRIDGILIKENGEVVLLQKLQTWLVKNELSSDTKAEFDEEFYKK